MEGKCVIQNTQLRLLYDSGATHSFISIDCMQRLNLETSELPYQLLVSTPTGENVKTTLVCLNCFIKIKGHSYLAHLVCLPLRNIDIIL